MLSRLSSSSVRLVCVKSAITVRANAIIDAKISTAPRFV